MKQRWGFKFNASTDAQSVYCRSGGCEQGRLIALGVGQNDGG